MLDGFGSQWALMSFSPFDQKPKRVTNPMIRGAIKVARPV
jgi:hypothetical protein